MSHWKKPRHREPRAGFTDPRSRTLWRTGRVILKGADMTAFRREIFRRADGRCEVIKSNGKRCNKYAGWDGLNHGELSHNEHGANRNDRVECVLWSCRACHKERHPGPQFAPERRRRAKAVPDSEGPRESIHG